MGRLIEWVGMFDMMPFCLFAHLRSLFAKLCLRCVTSVDTISAGGFLEVGPIIPRFMQY